MTQVNSSTQTALSSPQGGTTIACPSCDLLFDLGTLSDGASASCSRCGHFLSRRRDDALEQVAAYCTAALITMVMACTFPFLEFSRAGLENTMTLPQTVVDLWQNNMPWLAMIVASFILVIPLLVTLGMLVLAMSISNNRHPSWLRQLGSVVFHLQNWSMVEVFFIGVLVSLVKIGHMATVIVGISFWAYAAFSVLFTLAMTRLDKYQVWRRIEALVPA